jgi:hypothetical protein
MRGFEREHHHGCGVAVRRQREDAPRWMADDEAFKQELATSRRAMFEAAMNRLQQLAAQAWIRWRC